MAARLLVCVVVGPIVAAAQSSPPAEAIALGRFGPGSPRPVPLRVPGHAAWAGAQVLGVVVTGADMGPLTDHRVLLIPARAIDLMGRDIDRLPPQGTFVLDAPRDKPRGVARIEANGTFSFENVAEGRYVLGIVLSPDGAYEAANVVLLEHEQTKVVFDVKNGQTVNVGQVSVPVLRNQQ